MSAERQIPGGPFVNETTDDQEQIPGAQYIVEGVASTPSATTQTLLFLAI